MQNSGWGYLACSPKLIEKGGSILCLFRLAVLEKKTNKTHFLNFELWDTAATYFYSNANSGDTVFVTSIPREKICTKGEESYKTVIFRVTDFKLIKKGTNVETKNTSNI